MSAKVFHAHLYGTREAKYERLAENDVSKTQWTEVKPSTPFYLFAPQDVRLRQEYEAAWKVTDMMPRHGVGVTTARDHMVVDFEKEPLVARARTFRNSEESDAALCRQLRIPMKKGWNVRKARHLLQQVAEGALGRYVRPIAYRPFDDRLAFYHDAVVWRTVKQVMRHMLAAANVGLITTRSTEIARRWEHVFCTRRMTQHHTVSLKEVNYLFPLYLYPDPEVNADLLANATRRHANLRRDFIADLERRLALSFVANGTGNLKKTFGPEDVLHYAYAVFHSPTYRTRYAEFLKIDFPRLPLTSNLKLFRALAAKGAELVALHLLESPKVEDFLTDWPVKGDNIVEKVQYTEKDHRVWINKTQYFGGVPKPVWDFHIGGYQVCHKWLKDRKGRRLTYEDTQRYQKVVVALSETIRLMAEIDEVIGQHGGWPMK